MVLQLLLMGFIQQAVQIMYDLNIIPLGIYTMCDNIRISSIKGHWFKKLKPVMC